MSTKEARMARYTARKLEGRCVDCNAGLGDDDNLTCVECTARMQAWRASPAGRASARKAQQRYLKTESGRKANAKKTQRYRQRAIANGLCLQCTAKATRGRLCERHGAAHAARSKQWRAKQKASTT